MISLDLNPSSDSFPHRKCTRFQIPNFDPPNNCVVDEIILEITGHYFDKSNYVWASFNSDVDEEIICDDSSDSCISNSDVISKSTLVPIKPKFNNPSSGQTSKSSSDS